MAKQRSKAYPVLDLRDAVSLGHRLVGTLGSGAHDRDVIARALGYTNGSSGVAARKIAALVHFGLLDREHHLYGPSGLARKLIESHDPQGLKAARREAFLRPVLFRELFNAYLPGGKVPRELGTVLAREFGIAEAVKDDVATIFLESGLYASVLDADGLFIGPGGPLPFPQRELQGESREQRHTEEEGALERQVIKMALTRQKYAELSLPVNLEEDDILLLKKQIEFLELQARLNALRVIPHPASRRSPGES